MAPTRRLSARATSAPPCAADKAAFAASTCAPAERSFEEASSSSCWAIKPRLRFGGLLQAFVVGMQGRVTGLCGGNFMLRAGDLILTAGNLGNGTFQLSLQFRNFQNRQRLSLPDAVADIYFYGADEPGNLRVNVDHLIRLELSCERQDVRDRTPLHHRHPRRCRFRGGFDFTSPAWTEH